MGPASKRGPPPHSQKRVGGQYGGTGVPQELSAQHALSQGPQSSESLDAPSSVLGASRADGASSTDGASGGTPGDAEQPSENEHERTRVDAKTRARITNGVPTARRTPRAARPASVWDRDGPHVTMRAMTTTTRVTRAPAALPLALVLGVSAACTAAPDAPLDGGVPRADAPRADTGPTELVIGPTDRPARLALPTAHDGTTPLPLVLFLHGYSATSALNDGYLGVSRAARTRGLYVVLPEGTVDSSGNQFWNATDACCNFDGSTVDDVAYLEGLLDAAIAAVPVDPTRIYVMGHSNGGFMSYRMACEASERIAAIAPLAGVDFLDAARCVPTAPVSVLHWHGTLDETIPYDGEPGRHPSAPASAERWAAYAGCDAAGTPGDAVDLSVLAGAETVVTDWTAGCAPGVTVSLWRIEGEGHIPALERGAAGLVLDWLLAHHR